jgi:nucleotide-binding universal stress UspA family protein
MRLRHPIDITKGEKEMFEKILVPLDGSKVSEMVVPYAIELASLFGSTIIIAGVSESSAWQAVAESRSYLEKQSDRISEALTKRQPEGEGKARQAQVGFQSLVGNPASEIINYAAKIESNLIIMASRGASGGGPWPIGNVAEKILRTSNCPVLLIREYLDDSVIALKYILRKILVPLDGSKLSEAAFPLAVNLAKETGAEIVLLQVIESIDFSGYNDITPEVINKFKAGSHSAARDYLEKIKNSMINVHPLISTATGEKPAAEKIIDYSEANNCDLIVMSTNGRSGIGRWVFGSITDKVLHTGKKPVLVIRPKI